MINFDLNKMLFTLTPDEHDVETVTAALKAHPEVKFVSLTNATELEFRVKTPDDRADRAQLFISQELKEQYWKRVTGPVGTAMEETLEILDRYGFGVEIEDAIEELAELYRKYKENIF